MTASLVPGLGTILMAGAALALPTVRSGPLVHAGHPTRMPGGFDAAASAPDGSMRVATPTSSWPEEDETVTSIGPDGARGPRTRVLRPRRDRRGLNTAFTPVGAVTAFQSIAHRARRVAAVQLGADGRVSRPQLLSSPGYSAEPAGTIGGGGAVAVLFFEHKGDGPPRLVMAFQPAGASRLQPAQVIDDGAGNSWNEAIGASGGASYDIALGANGGALVAGPGMLSADPPGAPVRVRRIARDGTLGPWIAVGDGRYGSGSVALAAGDDGTVAIAMAMDDPRSETSSVLATSLPPGGDAVTPIQTLHRGAADEYASENLSVAVGPANETAVTTAYGQPAQTEVFTGPAGALTRTGVFDTPDPGGTIGTVTPDGGTTVVWSRNRVDGRGTAPIVATRRPPGGFFSTPHVVARSKFTDEFTREGIDADFLLPLRGGDAALGYYDRYSTFGSEGDGGGFNAYVARLTQ